jgi:hypothetical protein
MYKKTPDIHFSSKKYPGVIYPAYTQWYWEFSAPVDEEDKALLKISTGIIGEEQRSNKCILVVFSVSQRNMANLPGQALQFPPGFQPQGLHGSFQCSVTKKFYLYCRYPG